MTEKELKKSYQKKIHKYNFHPYKTFCGILILRTSHIIWMTENNKEITCNRCLKILK